MTGSSKPPKDPPVNPNATEEAEATEEAPAESEDSQGDDEQ